MSVYIDPAGIRQIHLGSYATKAGVTITNSSQSIFTVSGGLVLVTSLVGIVTTVIGGAANLNLTHTPTGGAAGDVAQATAIDADAVGTIYTVSGVAADLVSAVSAATPSVTYGFASGKFVLPAGSLKQKTSAVQTGAIAWHITYVPIESGAALTAA
jgi:hypothetical protein